MSCCNNNCNHDPCGSSFNQAVTKAAQYAQYAQTQANKAEDLWEEFNALYLGAFAVAPTEDNQGNPLQVGALYWNSSLNQLFSWNGLSWQVAANFTELTPFLATGTTTPRNLVTRFAEIANVKDFGAIGDGIADDTAAIQAAIDYWAPFNPFLSEGGDVYIPQGTYRITSSINLSAKHGIHISGAGVLATEIKADGDFPVFSSINTAATPWIDGQIANMTIRGGGNTNPNAHGVYTVFTNGCYLQNIAIYSCKYGLNINHAWQYHIENIDAHGGAIDKCDIGVYMGPTTLLNIDNAITANNIVVKDCITAGFRIINGQGSKFVNCEAGATPIGWYIGDPPSGTVECKWIHLVNCLADTTTDSGWKIVKGAATELGQMQFTNCWSGNNTAVGANGLVYISEMQDSVFDGMQLQKCTNNAIQLLNSNKIVFSDFVLNGFNGSNTNKHAIVLTNTNRSVFNGVLTPSNIFSNSDANETGTSNSNIFRITNSNGASLVGADSRHYENDTAIKSGAGFGLTLRASSGSSILSLQNNTPKTFNIASRNDDYFVVSDGATARILIHPTTGDFFPGTDDTQKLGVGSNKWSEVFAGNPVINTSDERQKQDIQEITETEKLVAAKLKTIIKKYRFKNAVEKKGDAARIHIGVIAQEVRQAFIEHGLNAEDYGMFCYDEWDEMIDPDTKEVLRKAGNSYGIRYGELLAFILTADQ